MAEITEIAKKCLKQVSVTLPQGYSIEDIEKSIDKFYPFEWRIINERYKEYSKADVKLAKFNKKQRYRMPSPREILSNLPETKVLLKDDTKEKYSLYYGSDDWREEYQAFCTERYGKNNKRQSKIEKALEKAQRVEPEFLDRLIGLYDRKNTSQKDKVYIVVELEKYYCEKTINLRRWTKGYTIKQPNMDCQPTEITALMRHRAVFSQAEEGGIPTSGA